MEQKHTQKHLARTPSGSGRSPLLDRPLRPNLPPPASGQMLVDMLDQFDLSTEDVEELEHLMNGSSGNGVDK
jgi:hypothetical protein